LNSVPPVPIGRAAIAADLGGTKLAIGLVDSAGKVASYRAEPVLAGTAGITRLVELIRRLRDERQEAVSVGVGATGLIEWPSGTIVWAPGSGHSVHRLRSLIEEATGLPAVVDTDVNVAAYGELIFGAGRGASNMLVLTVGTGIGCTLVVNGAIFRGAHGFAGEGGHMTVNLAGPRCRCGRSGCFEALCSGTALEQAVARATGRAGPGAKQSGQAILAAAKDGDAVAIAAVRDVGRWLGIGLASLINVLDPERVIVGGGLAGAGELLFGPARQSLSEYLTGQQARTAPEIIPARLGPRAGVIGAGALALDLHRRGVHVG
jgi:glucokinase